MAAALFTTEYPKLAAINSLTWAANKILLLTGAGTVTVADATAAGLALLDDVDAAAQRATLGAIGNSGNQQIDSSGHLTVNSSSGAFTPAGTEAIAAFGTGTTIISCISSGGQASQRVYSYGASTSQIRGYRAAGTYGTPTDLATNDIANDMGGWGYVGGAFTELSRLRTTLISATPGATNKATQLLLSLGRDGSATPAAAMAWQYQDVTCYGAFSPSADNTFDLGKASFRWAVVRAATGTINTSDARVKRDVGTVPDELLDAWGAVEWVQYRFLDAYAEKGDDARWHMGLIAQQVRDAIDAAMGEGSAIRFGLVCHDQWDAQEEIRQPIKGEREIKIGRGKKARIEVEEFDTGETEVVREAREAGDRWGLRYEECFAVEAAYQRRRMARIEKALGL